MLEVRWELLGQECRHTPLGRRREGVGSRVAVDGSRGRPQEGLYQATIVARTGRGGDRGVPLIVASSAVQGCVVVGPGLGPRVKDGGRGSIEPHDIPVDHKWDAKNSVGVIDLGHVNGLREP